jgi:hypothetical protein
MTAQITAGVIGVLLAGAILYLVRRDHLHGSYALWWLAVAVVILLLGVFPPIIDWLGSVTGIYYPPVLPIIVGIGMILIRMLKMDIDRSQQERQLRRLTQKLAILEQELTEVRRANPASRELPARESLSRESTPLPSDLPRVVERR